ncbi:MAG: O-antigen ligase family protein [Chlamydiia bacterium]|nr:O-antigen ligase family protein [Chlamydiia bacterium]
MKERLITFFTLLFIAAFPFANHLHKVLRGVSVSFVHSFKRLAPFPFSLPPLFQKTIHFYGSDLWIFALFLGALWTKECSIKTLFWNPHSRYLTLFIAVALFSLFFSLFSHYYFQYTTLLNLTLSFLAFHLVYQLMKKRYGLLSIALWWIVAIAALECLIGCGQFLMQRSLGLSFLAEPQITPLMENIATYPLTDGNRAFFDRLPWIGEGHTKLLRAYGTFDHPNIFGGYLVLTLFANYFLFIRSKRAGQRIFSLCVLLLQLLTLALTFSRGPIFAWAIGTLLFFGVGWLKKGLFSTHERKRFIHLLCGIGGGFLTVFALLFQQLIARGGFVNYNGLATASDSGRLLYYKIAAKLFLDHPFLGIGYNSFPLFPYEKVDPAFAGANPVGGLAHNIYLQVASETGLLGLGVLALFVVSLYRPFWKGGASLLTLTLGILFFTLLIMGLADHFLWAYPSGRLILLITGALLAASFSASQPLWQGNIKRL